MTNAGGGGSTFLKPLDNVGNKTIPDYPAYVSQFIYTITIPGCARPAKFSPGNGPRLSPSISGQIFDLVNFVPIEGASAPGADDWRLSGRHHAEPRK